MHLGSFWRVSVTHVVDRPCTPVNRPNLSLRMISITSTWSPFVFCCCLCSLEISRLSPLSSKEPLCPAHLLQDVFLLAHYTNNKYDFITECEDPGVLPSQDLLIASFRKSPANPKLTNLLLLGGLDHPPEVVHI